MPAQWIAYCVVIALLLAGAARVAEYGFDLYSIPLRWPWLAALLGSAGLPLAAFFFPDRAALSAELLGYLPVGSLLGTLLTEPASAAQAESPRLLAALNAAALALWLLGSVGLLIFYTSSYIRLSQARRSWARRSIWGRDVFLSQSLGPAVTGFFRSFIVLPAWVLALQDRERRIVVLHEEEHLRTGDHRVLLAGLCALVAMPWNLPLWWQFRRLRLAMEIDCDRRVLRSGVNRLEYGELLLQVGHRAARTNLLPAAFLEPRSLLETRMNKMIRRMTRHRIEKAGAAALAAVALLTFACEAPRPGEERIVEPPISDTPEPSAKLVPPGGETPVFTPYTVTPRLKDRQKAVGILEDNYPRKLKQAGTGGTATVWVFIDETGVVRNAAIHKSSGQVELDEAALRAVREFEFTPARNGSRSVSVWIALPITFAVYGPAGR